MLPVAALAHSARGRTRFRIAGKHRPEDLGEIEERLRRVPGVEEVKASPVTGTVLVQHRAALQQVVEYAEREGIFRLDAGGSKPLREALGERFRALDGQIRTFSGGTLDLEALALLTLLGVGSVSLLRGQIAVPAVTAFWYAAALLATPAEGGRRS
jgi:copper chaperone CopZ